MMKLIYISDFNKLFSYLKKEHKIKFYFSILLMILYTICEVISIGALLPFVAAILSPEKIYNFEIIQKLNLEKYLEGLNIQFIFTLLFISFVLIANIFRIFVQYTIIKLSKLIPLDLSTKIYKILTDTNYKDFKQKNSAKIISIITDKMDSLSGVFYNFLSAAASLIASLGIVTLLLFIDFKISSISIFFGILFYFVVGILIKKILKKNSITLSTSSTLRIKHVRETFGSIKQILLESKQSLFSNIFEKFEKEYRFAQFKNQFLNTSPRFIIEGLGIIFISITIYFLYKILNYDAIFIISLVGVIAFAFQKLLPHLNTIYVCYTALVNYSEFIKEVNLELDEIEIKNKNKYQNKIVNNEIEFNKKLDFENISFKYNSNNNNVINSLSFNIDKGSKVGLIGPTGSGKTTCLDIIMGLLPPSEGLLKIDDVLLTKENLKSWQNKIAHVPQDIFFMDASIRDNIIFNFANNSVDEKDLIQCAKLAEIHEFIDSLPNKYNTRVGENGILLSGGQRQRIGIARALFNKKEILTLDEATNALDILTEQKILNNINKKKITIIQISHRLNTLEGYDKIIKL